MAEFNIISSLKNPKVKQVVKLRDRRGREEQQRILIDGLREITHAVAAGVHVEECFCCAALAESSTARQIIDQLDSQSVPLFWVSEQVWEKIAFGNRSDGIVLVARPPQIDLAALPAKENGLFVVLDGVEKPGNIGAVCRTADAAGVHGLILSDPRTDTYNPNAIRASLGTLFRLPVVNNSSSFVAQWLVERRLQVIIATVDADMEYDDADFRVPTAFVLGSEATGVGPTWRSRGQHVLNASWRPVRLPMHGAADSLNVSNTAAILLYEALRQRKQSHSPQP